MYEQIRVKIKGITPTCQHNGQLADPLNKWSKAMKAITGKGKKKTDEDIAELSRLEWMGSLYADGTEPGLVVSGRIGWPGDNLEALIRSAAKATKQGKDVQRGILVDGFFPMEYDGPKDIDKLFTDERFRMVNGVKVGASRVMRTRPAFPTWSLEFTIDYLPNQLNKSDIEGFMEYAAINVALSDRRPKYGRFEVVQFD
jgi:hypothetical protein